MQQARASPTYVLEARGPVGRGDALYRGFHNLIDAVREPLQAAERGAEMQQPLATNPFSKNTQCSALSTTLTFPHIRVASPEHMTEQPVGPPKPPVGFQVGDPRDLALARSGPAQHSAPAKRQVAAGGVWAGAWAGGTKSRRNMRI